MNKLHFNFYIIISWLFLLYILLYNCLKNICNFFRCKELNLLSRTTFITPRHATKEELMTRHNIEHIDKLEKTSGLEDIEKLEDFSSHYDAVYVHPVGVILFF